MSTLLWDTGTTGIVEESGGAWVAGYDQENDARHAAAILAERLGAAVVGYQIDRYQFAGSDQVSTVPLPGGLDPLHITSGSLFGHGSHPTTQLVLNLMSDRVRPGVRVLDLGAGTGVLAIAALRMGAASVTAVELDPAATSVVSANLADNGFAPDALRLLIGSVQNLPSLLNGDHASTPDMSSDEGQRESQVTNGDRYDLVVVNVLLPIHRLVASGLAPTLADDATIITAGVLQQDQAELHALYRDSLPHAVVDEVATAPAAGVDDETSWLALAFATTNHPMDRV